MVDGAGVNTGTEDVKLTSTTVVGVRTSMAVDEVNCDTTTLTLVVGVS